MNKLLILIWALCCCATLSADELPVVPRPMSAERHAGSFVVDARTQIVVTDSALNMPARIFARDAGKLLGREPAIVAASPRNAIRLQLLAEGFDSEEYLLEIGPQGITVSAANARGVLYGLRTLQQLLADDVRIPACTVRDKPCFAYRGAMLDVSRHFFPVGQVKRFIDMLSLHKINRFHWHLTDDQGWRIEIRRYPELTRVGSRRAETLVGRYDPHRGDNLYDGTPYGGFYTQEEIREVVRYAAERGIEVIPEIEMPGHGMAALTAYPWLGCTEGPYEVRRLWGISEDVYCAGRETTFEFVEQVLSEVLELFPSKLIHIGGDECPKTRWKQCPACRERIRREGLRDEYELQSYFIRRVEKWLRERGREVIGWDEILEGGISKSATIMVWRDQKHGIEAARAGNPVIMTPKWHCYFDYSQTSDPERLEPLCVNRYVSVRQVYRLEPCDRLNLHHARNVLGVQCNLWTEYIADMRHAEQMLLPRMAALAEVGWACDRKDYRSFTSRLGSLRTLYETEGYHYARYLFEGIE